METDARQKRIERWVKVGLIGLVALIVSPVILMTIKGLLGLVVAGLIVVTTVQLAPVFAFKLANWRMKLIMAEAGRNPIETMKNVYLEKSQIIQEKDAKIVEFEGRIGDYHDKMVVFTRRYPDEAPKFQEVEDKMRRALANMKHRQADAKAIQHEYALNIDKAEAIYQMALAAAEVTQLSRGAEDQVFMDIKQQVSFDAVNHKFNTAVASLALEVDNDQEYVQPQLALPRAAGDRT